MNKIQKGGLDPLAKVPKFKYTFNEKRKLFIGYIYPYSEYFINCVTAIPFSSYSYNDAGCEYINFDNKEQKVSQCSSSGYPQYFFVGGTVYELLNKQFNNVNMHKYCDATGDIDVALYPPKLTYNPGGDIYFLNTDGKINSFYSHFTKWTFENLVKNVKSIQMLVNNMEHIIDFNINEYDDIPNDHKIDDFGYITQLLGKLYVVAFLNEDKTMFKIQVVCKVEDSGISVIDHIIEIIVPLPESDIGYSPSGDDYTQPSINTILLNTTTFNVASYSSLINDNINAYIERKKAYGSSNENIYKSINHVARLFYLYELIYQNQTVFPVDKIPLLFLYGMKQQTQKELLFLYYYKIINGNFNTIKVDTRFFLNSYLELIMKTQNVYQFKRKNPDYFINSTVSDIKQLHDRFIVELFNDDLFESSGLLTFSETTGGKKIKRKHTTKNTKKHKKSRNTQKTKKSRSTKKNKKTKKDRSTKK